MGKFDGILILSDLDGTFTGAEDNIAVENMKAVRYFTENGGKFGFATGRSPSFVKEREYFSVVNAPCCFLNGGAVYDTVEDKVLYERHLEFSVKQFFHAIADISDGIAGIFVSKNCRDKESVLTGFDEQDCELLSAKPVKIICVFESEEKALEFRSKVSVMPFFISTYISRSWNVGVEFNAFNGTKGNAIRFIKEHLGNIHASVGVGDFENDLTLIMGADVGVAVGNAINSLKQMADMVVKRNSECAIKDLIEKFDEKI